MAFTRRLLLAGLFALASSGPVAAQGQEGDRNGLLPLAQIMDIARGRYDGDVIEAELKSGKRHEMTDLVYELRMLTRRGDVLKIRLDATNGDFLEVDGRGLIDARKLP